MIRRKHVFLLAKLAVGALVIFMIARQLSLDDEVVVVTPGGDAVERGRDLSVSDDAQVRFRAGQAWRAAPFSRTTVFRTADGKYRVEVREPGGVYRDAADEVEFRGVVTMVGPDGNLGRRDLSSLKVREEGSDPIRIAPALKYGLRSIFGRLDDRPIFAIGAFAFMVLAYMTAILRWQLLLRTQGLIVTYWRAFKLTFIGFFFNNVLPGLTGGDIVKAVMIAQDHPEERPAAVGTVIVDRVLGLLVLALMSAGVLAFTYDRYPEAAIAVFGFLGAASVGLTVLLSRRVRSAIKLDQLAKKLPGASIMKKLDRALFLYRSQKKTMLQASLLSIVSHCGNIGAILCFGLGIGLDQRAGLEGNPVIAYLATVPIILIVSSRAPPSGRLGRRRGRVRVLLPHGRDLEPRPLDRAVGRAADRDARVQPPRRLLLPDAQEARHGRGPRERGSRRSVPGLRPDQLPCRSSSSDPSRSIRSRPRTAAATTCSAARRATSPARPRCSRK